MDMDMQDLKAAIDDYSDAAENEIIRLKERLDGIENKLQGTHTPYPGWEFIYSRDGSMHHVPTFETTQKMQEALIWCSGSADFGEGGQARKGWLNLCQPLIDNFCPTEASDDS